MGSSVILPAPGQPTQGPDPGFVSAAVPNVVEFAFQGIGPPTALYLQRDDFVLINAVSNIASEIVQGEIRYLLPVPPQAGQPDMTPAELAKLGVGKKGVIITEQFTLNLAAAVRTVTSQSFSLGECYLLSLGLQARFAVQRGQTYVRCSLNRGGGTNLISTVAQFLVSDYPTVVTPIGWPGGRQIGSQESTGFLHTVLVTNPAAGADWTFTVPASARMRISSLQAQFAAGAAAANRNVQILVDDGANVYWTADVGATIVANTTDQIVATGTNAPTGAVATTQSMVLPPGLILPAGHRVRTVTQNIQAADQWSAIVLSVEEWLDQI